MAHFNSSNVMINGGTFISAQGDRDSGMYYLRFVQKTILIDDSMKDFIPWK
jgi:hypothetical protein